MSVNTSIYGTPEQWGVANLGTTQNHADRKDSFLTAYFGGGGNALEDGYGYGISLNTPIDKSLSYCGLGNFSSWSKIEYYKRNRDFELIGKDNRTVTNFSFNQAVKVATMTGIWWAENTSWTSTRYGSRCRFAPDAVNSSSQGNYNNGFIPITQIPIKNCVLVPIFRVAKQINTDGTTTGMDIATVNCWDYYGTTATRNHTTHPYILGIGFSFYTKTSDSSSQRSSVSSSLSAILDELALYKNVPVDLQRPDQSILSGGYSYCWNVPQSTFAYKQIFGYVNNASGAVSNAIDYRVNDLPTSSRTDLLRAIAIFPHEKAVFSDEWAVNSTTYARYYYLQYYDNGPDDNLREWVRKQLACFGLFFTDVSASVAQTGEFDSDDMFLGILDDNNIGQGFYTSGEDNRNQKQWNWETTNDSEYDPSGSGGGSAIPITDPIGPNRPGFTLAVGNGSVCYTITKTEWRRIWDDIYGGSTDWKSLVNGLALYGANPLNAILNYRWYPFTLGGSQTNPIVLGSTTVEPATHVYHYVSSSNEAFTSTAATFWWGDNKQNFINIRKSKARVWLPFYGYYELPMTQLVDRTLKIQFQYNLPDDTAVWVIMFGDSIYDYVECQPYIEIPITGDNSLQIAAAKAQRNLSIAMTVGAATLAAGATILAPTIGAAITAGSEAAWSTGGVLSGIAATISQGAGAELITAPTIGAALTGAGAIAGGGIKAANTVMNSALQIGNLSTNIPIHSAGSDTTFLHLPFAPYVEIFTNKVIKDYKDPANGVDNEGQYKLKVGISCDKWVTVEEMPEATLLKATGLANTDTSGMELDEINELNNIIQTGFYK